MSWVRLFLFVVLLSFTFSLSAQPTSQDKQRATELTDSAKVDYKAGRYSEALKKFEEAYQLDPTAERAFNIGQTYRELHEANPTNRVYLQQAIAFFEVYIQQRPNNPDIVQVKQKVSELKLQLQNMPSPPPASLSTLEPGPTITEPPYKPPWELLWLPAAFTVGTIGFGVRAIDKKRAAESELDNGGPQAIIQEGERAPVVRNALASDLCLIGAGVSMVFIIKPAPIRPQLEAITQKILPKGKQ